MRPCAIKFGSVCIYYCISSEVSVSGMYNAQVFDVLLAYLGTVVNEFIYSQWERKGMNIGGYFSG